MLTTLTPLFDKLQLRAGLPVVVLDAPDSFEAELSALPTEAIKALHRTATALPNHVPFALAFVSTQAALEATARLLTARAHGDAVLWFAYPKKTSRRYTCQFDRDSGWDAMGAAGYEPVRMVAIDEDWSALRFRKARYIRKLTRDPARAMSAAGQVRAAASREARLALKAAPSI